MAIETGLHYRNFDLVIRTYLSSHVDNLDIKYDIPKQLTVGYATTAQNAYITRSWNGWDDGLHLWYHTGGRHIVPKYWASKASWHPDEWLSCVYGYDKVSDCTTLEEMMYDLYNNYLCSDVFAQTDVIDVDSDVTTNGFLKYANSLGKFFIDRFRLFGGMLYDGPLKYIYVKNASLTDEKPPQIQTQVSAISIVYEDESDPSYDPPHTWKKIAKIEVVWNDIKNLNRYERLSIDQYTYLMETLMTNIRSNARMKWAQYSVLCHRGHGNPMDNAQGTIGLMY